MDKNTNPFALLNRWGVGFEPLFDMLDILGGQDGYPPYNINSTSADEYLIEIAVAGFGEADLEVQVEGDNLTVRGKKADAAAGTSLHRGIATRQFERRFKIAKDVEVSGVTLENGLLSIVLTRAPGAAAKKIPIQRR